jgi:hypothetical protein
MTLDIENCHATVHAKKVKMSKLEYARSFGATMKESVKRAPHCMGSGVTTMGSDRENPGAPNLNGPNGGPQV